MKIQNTIKTAVLTAAGFAMTLSSVAPADAGCHGSRYSSRRAIPMPHYVPSHRRNVHHQPVVRHQPIVRHQPVTPQMVQPVQTQIGQPVGGVPVTTGQAIANVQPAQTSVAPNASAQLPTNSQPVTPQAVTRTPAASQPATTPAASNNNSEASALAMLASLSSDPKPAPQPAAQIPQFTASSTTTTGNHIGNWRVTLPGNQTVMLSLNADSSFVWTVSKDGKSNAFQGQFRLEGDQLTLVRSNDLQQMKGRWTGNDNQFTFKLDGATTGGLTFTRG